MRPWLGDAGSRRRRGGRRRPGRVRRPGHGRAGRRRAARAARGAPVPERAGHARAGRCTGTSCGCTPTSGTGCGRGGRRSALASVGIDSWGVDYGLLDDAGRAARQPGALPRRADRRGAGRLLAAVPAGELYAITGIQQLPFNTIYQLAAAAGTPAARGGADTAADPGPARLLADRGDRRRGHERVDHRSCSTCRPGPGRPALMERAGIPPRMFPPLRQPGDVIGAVQRGPATSPGVTAPLPVVAVGSHDTASAVVAVPAAGPRLRLHLLAEPGHWWGWSWPHRC